MTYLFISIPVSFVSHDGTVLAVASSYTFEEGQKDFTPEDNVSLRRIDVSEARPRQKM
jgi:cell cycle arrest protein BUB3